jgi:O-antigen/teichoic acid export membrane protein
MTALRKLFRNTVFLSASQLITRALGFITIILIARGLGNVGLGVISFAFAVGEILSQLADLGVYTYVTKASARDERSIKSLYSNYMSMKLSILLALFLIVNSIAFIVPAAQSWNLVILMASVAYAFSSLNNPIYAVCLAKENLAYESIGRSAEAFLMLAGIASFIPFGLTVFHVLLATLIAKALVFFALFFIFSKKRFLPIISADTASWGRLLKESVHFWLTSLFALAYSYIAIIMLTFLAGPGMTGWFSAASKLVISLSAIPVTIMYVAFPAISRLYTTDSKLLSQLIRKLAGYLLVLIIPIAFGTVFIAHDLISLLYGNGFAPAVPVLQMLIWAEVFVFLNTAWVMLLVATEHQSRASASTGMALVANVILCLVLIPSYSLSGAVIAAIAVEAGLCIYLYLLIRKRLFYVGLGEYLLKAIIAAFVMVIPLLFLDGLFTRIAAGILVYAAAAFALRIFSLKEVAWIIGNLKGSK